MRWNIARVFEMLFERREEAGAGRTHCCHRPA
jgi:hypothetical protein